MIISVCVGSSCYLRGSNDVIELFREAISGESFEQEITLAGSFCIEKCNREGVTVQIDDDIYTNITKANFDEFFRSNVMCKLV